MSGGECGEQAGQARGSEVLGRAEADEAGQFRLARPGEQFLTELKDAPRLLKDHLAL